MDVHGTFEPGFFFVSLNETGDVASLLYELEEGPRFVLRAVRLDPLEGHELGDVRQRLEEQSRLARVFFEERLSFPAIAREASRAYQEVLQIRRQRAE